MVNKLLLFLMEITIPRKRTQNKWRQNEPNVQRFMLNQRQRNLQFQQYCKLSLYCIDAPWTDISETYPNILKNPTIAYSQRRKQGEQQKRLVQILAYGWENIINLIKGQRQNAQNSLGIYTEQNITIHFGRLQQMLIELKSRSYNCQVYLRQNIYAKEMQQKQLSQQLIFIKLLQNILKTQTIRIQEVRMTQNRRQLAGNQNEREESIVQRIKPIDVTSYFHRKYNNQDKKVEENDAIDRLYQKRKFNGAAFRYHLPSSQRT